MIRKHIEIEQNEINSSEFSFDVLGETYQQKQSLRALSRANEQQMFGLLSELTPKVQTMPTVYLNLLNERHEASMNMIRYFMEY